MTLACIATFVLTLTTANVSGASDRRNFWALNNTGKEITDFYVSPHDASTWGNNILPVSLPDGVGAVITFNSGIKTTCLMDFRLRYADGSEQLYLQGRDVCRFAAVQFNMTTSTVLVFP
jgi:hypothetical protein